MLSVQPYIMDLESRLRGCSFDQQFVVPLKPDIMEKLIILALALMIGSFSAGNYEPSRPAHSIYYKADGTMKDPSRPAHSIYYKADDNIKDPSKPAIQHHRYIIKDMDPH
jgi:hypothetical protein